MKKIFFALFFVFSSHVLFAQLLNPVDWTVTSKKINDKVYEVHLIATINKGWHIYSQNTPEGGPGTLFY